MWCVAVVWILSIAAAPSLAASAVTKSDEVTVYRNAARTFQFSFDRNAMRVGALITKRAQKSHVRDVFEGEVLGGATTNCSDTQYKCINTGVGIMAVPRDGVSADTSYTHLGGNFRVTKCVKVIDGKCSVVIIRSECLRSAEKLDCVSQSTSNPSALIRKVVHFIFNEDVGVSAFVEGDRALDTAQRGGLLDGSVYLKGDKGLLFE
jgi:hypothetical protein